MKKSKLFIILLVTNITFLYGQENNSNRLIGKYTTNNYSHNNRYHYEEITLYSDSTFEYRSKANEFVKLNVKGRWSVSSNHLLLNSIGKKNKLEVKESYDSSVSNGMTKFVVTSFKGTGLNYKVSTIKADTTIVLSNQFESTVVPMTQITEFKITSSLFGYPKYNIVDTKNNLFIVKLSEERIFLDEQWQIVKDGILRPKGLDENYSGYFLMKQ